MADLIFLAVVIAWLLAAPRFVMPFARDHVEAELKEFAILYKNDKPERDRLNRTAIWVGVFKALFWPYVLIYRWITGRLVHRLTAPERKAKELADARKVIADYEAEQARKGR